MTCRFLPFLQFSLLPTNPTISSASASSTRAATYATRTSADTSAKTRERSRTTACTQIAATGSGRPRFRATSAALMPDCRDKSPRPTCEAKGWPNRYADCDLDVMRCERCGDCRTSSDCEDGYCCVSELSSIDPNYGQCYPFGDFKRIYSADPKYLCAS